MTAVVACLVCSGNHISGLPAEVKEAALRANPQDGIDHWGVGLAFFYQFCSRYAVAYSEEDASRGVLRVGPDGWVEVDVPDEPVAESVGRLYGQLDSTMSLIGTEDQFRLVIPEPIARSFWWESVPAISVLSTGGREASIGYGSELT